MSNLVATSAKTEIIKRLFATFEAGPSDPTKAADEYVTFLTEDARFRLGNPEPLVGREAIQDSLVAFCQQVKGIYHDVKQMWEPEENVVLLNLEVTYNRLDGTAVTLPVMDFFRFQGDLIQELQIFMDINPLFA
jgi:ketosteroid isomerase-like protein